MEKGNFYKKVYLIGALWNWVLGISFIFATFFMKFAFRWFGIELPNTFVWMHLFFILFFYLGFVNYAVYKDPIKYYFFGKLCVFGRFFMISIMLTYFFLGSFNALIFLIIIPGSIIAISSIGYIGYFKDKQ